jgi:glycosyltransferase involved in cell wall biosynthesis
VGRFTYYKGFQHLLEAVAMVPHGRAVMVGEGPLRAQMIRRAAELNLSERIIFTGRLPDTDLHALMRLCRVFVLPSIERTEAFGLVLAEAMRYGTPCISTRVPGSGMSWVNREGETGLTVAPGDAAGLAEAMSRMFASDDLRDMLAAGALERFAELFHIDAVARMVRGVYEESLSRSA